MHVSVILILSYDRSSIRAEYDDLLQIGTHN